MKKKHVEEFCKQFLQFANVSPDWKLQIIPKIIKSAYTNCARKVLSTFKNGHVLCEYMSPPKTKA